MRVGDPVWVPVIVVFPRRTDEGESMVYDTVLPGVISFVTSTAVNINILSPHIHTEVTLPLGRLENREEIP